ncbi:MAG TPA: hypothetical protein VMT85_04120 [Thermoanaerobaculia bacterium]|nr:hypothetical protein [Thermoanaerobaculia bacterium]
MNPARPRFVPSPARAALAALVLASLAGAVPGVAEEGSSDGADPRFQGMAWRNIGPFRGGRSNASTGVPTQPQVYYFGGVGSGVWKTTDGGEVWVNVSDDTFGTSSVGAIAVAGSDPNVVYVGMGEHAVRGVMTSHGDGVYRSNDAGRTWSHLGLDRVRQISAVRIHPDDPQTAWVAAQGAPYGPTEERGVYKTTDGGATWRNVLYVNRTTGASSLSVDPDNPRVLYAGLWDHLRTPWEVRSGGPGSSIWKSVDGGETWNRIGQGDRGFPEPMGKVSVAAAPRSERLYALIEADPGGGVYRSEDGGETWEKVNEDWGLRARAWYYIKIYADPTNPEVVWVSNARLYRSIDGGRTFSQVGTPHGDNHDLWINPLDPDLMINANDGGANVSFDGGRSWSTQQNQPTAQFYRVNVDNQFPYHVYGGQQDNSAIAIESRSPGGIGWQDFYSVAGCESAWAAFDPDAPEPAVRSAGGGFGGSGVGPRSRLGQNPPGPATLDFVLPELPVAASGDDDEPTVVVEIRDPSGELVRRFEGRPKPAPADGNGGGVGDAGEESRPDAEGATGEEPPEKPPESHAKELPENLLEQAAEAQITELEVKPGHNRLAWDLRHQQVQPVPGRFVFGSLAGRRVVPGTYTVTLRAGGEETSAELEVLIDPRVSATLEDYQAQEQVMLEIDRQLEEIHRTTLRVRSVRDQVERFLGAAKDHPEADAVVEAGRELIEDLTEIEEALVQKRTVDGQTVINFEPRLDFHFVFLRNAVEGSEGVVTQGQRDRLRDLAALWSQHWENADAVLGGALDAFNALVREKGVPTVLVP